MNDFLLFRLVLVNVTESLMYLSVLYFVNWKRISVNLVGWLV